MKTIALPRHVTALLAPLLIIAVGALNGCAVQAPAAGSTDVGPSQDTSAAANHQSQQVAVRHEPVSQPQRVVRAQPAADDAPADDDVRTAKNPLIRGVQQLLDSALGAADFTEERDDLSQTLAEADAILTRVKRENRSALRRASRQVRVLGPASPNVILIVANGLQIADLSCYDDQANETPNIDRLAAEGTRFTSFRATHPPALSRWALLTGLEPADDSKSLLRPEHLSLGEVMWQAGYATGFIGLWGVPESSNLQGPNAHGFDEWLGYFRENETDSDYPESLWSNSKKIKLAANTNGRREQSATDFFLQEIAMQMERHHRRRPFFLAVVLPAPGDATTRNGQDRSASIAAFDQHVGTLLEELTRLRVSRNTSVCLTSVHDKGAAMTTNVPLLVRWPNRVQAGRVSDCIGGFHDLLPTFAELAGAIRQPREIDGTSMLSAWTARELADVDPVGD